MGCFGCVDLIAYSAMLGLEIPAFQCGTWSLIDRQSLHGRANMCPQREFDHLTMHLIGMLTSPLLKPVRDYWSRPRRPQDAFCVTTYLQTPQYSPQNDFQGFSSFDSKLNYFLILGILFRHMMLHLTRCSSIKKLVLSSFFSCRFHHDEGFAQVYHWGQPRVPEPRS